MNNDAEVKVGCILIIRNDDKVLLGLRKNCYGAGDWGLPGGHMDYNERAVLAVCREANEELGVAIRPRDLKFVGLSDYIVKSDKERHLQLAFEYIVTDSFSFKNTEPEYCDEWKWFNFSKLPDNIVTTHLPILNNYRSEIVYNTKDTDGK